MQWIERWWGVAPDLGSGTLELALVLGFLLVAAWLVAGARPRGIARLTRRR